MSREACPFSNDACKYFYYPSFTEEEDSGCFSDEHHLYYPRAKYVQGYEKKFRELPENKIQICRRIHDELHAQILEADKPKRRDINRALGGISIHSEYLEQVEEIIDRNIPVTEE